MGRSSHSSPGPLAALSGSPQSLSREPISSHHRLSERRPASRDRPLDRTEGSRSPTPDLPLRIVRSAVPAARLRDSSSVKRRDYQASGTVDHPGRKTAQRVADDPGVSSLAWHGSASNGPCTAIGEEDRASRLRRPPRDRDPAPPGRSLPLDQRLPSRLREVFVGPRRTRLRTRPDRRGPAGARTGDRRPARLPRQTRRRPPVKIIPGSTEKATR